jgi:hypothetical protein
MSTLLLVLGLLPKLIPIVAETVVALETATADAGSGQGTAKKDALLAGITEAVTVFAPEAGLDPAKVVQFVGKLTDVVVTLFNKIGVFKK